MRASEDHPDNIKLEHEEGNLRDKPRWCTDILFMLLIVFSWIAMTVVGWEAIGIFKSDSIPRGNPSRLIHSSDYNGKFCGVDDGLSKLRYAYYLADGAVVCVEKCPNYNDYSKFICKYDHQYDADQSIVTGYQYVLQLSCMYQVKTRSLLYRCIPDTNTLFASESAESTANSYGVHNVTAVYAETSTQNTGWFSNFLGDLLQLRGYIFGFGIGVTLGVALLYLFFLRIPYLLTILIWSIAIGIFVLFILSSFLLWSLAKRWSHDGLHSGPEIVTMYTFAYIGMVITALYFCLLVVMRKRIQLAIGIVKETSRAFTAMPSVIFLPILQTMGIVMFLVPWFIYVLYLASSGEKVMKEGSLWLGGKFVSYSYTTYSYATNTKYAFVYMLFCWFWTSEFIIALGQIILSLCFAAWYFTRKKDEVGNATVLWAFRTSCFYHPGTAAFGALIITIVKMIRVVILYIEKQMKTRGTCLGPCFFQYVMCILNCFLACVENLLRFINTNAYIMTAIYGYSFCTASKKAFFLLLRNILRVSAVSLLSSFVLWLGQLFTPLASTFLCYLALAYSLDSAKVSGIIAPLIFTFFLSYWVSSIFMQIFGMGIETILLCFIADEEMNPMDQRFARKELVGVITDSERKREELQLDVPMEYSRYTTGKEIKAAEYKKVDVMDQLTMQDDAVDTTVVNE